MAAEKRVLLCVENLSVPTDRRVWQEAQTLVCAGYRVDVICPAGDTRDTAPFEARGGVSIHRYRPHAGASGLASYAREYGVALRETNRLIRQTTRHGRYDVVHVCNPPDFMWLAALGQKLRGAALVFDHHDLAPELFRSRFGDRRAIGRTLEVCERSSFRMADVVLSTNESYRRVAIERGRKDPADVFVVRNAPDLERFRAVPPDDSLKRGRPHLIAYLGVMGPQDGVDNALRALAELRRSRDDWHAVFLGEGTERPALERLAVDLGLSGCTEFTGWADDGRILPVLSTATLCLSPEGASPLNNSSTMMKVAEYMAFGRPVVAFDLPETRRTAGEAAFYAPPGDVPAYAQNIRRLLDDPALCRRLGGLGSERVASQLSWQTSADALLAAYRRALGDGSPAAPPRTPVAGHAG